MNDLTVILPALNEERSIGMVIDEIKKFSDADILVANNGSTDNTELISLNKGANVLNIPTRGKGNAIREAFKKIESPFCIVLDSDYTYPPKYIPSIKAELIDGADVVIGYRAWKKSKAMPVLNSVGNDLLSILASLLYNHRLYDICTGMWGFRKEAIDKLELVSKGFTLEADILSNIKRNGCRISQVPIEYRARLNGSKAKLRATEGFKIGWFIMRNRWRK
jgi:dolichol-phosphate mannosyltransferase